MQPNGSTTVMEDAFTIPGMLSPKDTPLSALEGISLAGRDFHVDTPYQETMNLTIQRQLTAHDAFSVSYVGSFGRHLMTSGSNNATSSIMPVGTNTHDMTIPGHVPFPDLGTGSTTEDAGASSYNSLQAVYNHELSYGVSFNANYTLSNCMSDTQNPQGNDLAASGGYRAEWVPGLGKRIDWSLCGWDSRNVFHVYGTWHLPIGRGTPFLGNVNYFTNAFIGGWVTNLIFIQQSGQPITVGCNPSTSANVGCFANKVPGVNPYRNAHNREHWLNINAFSEPPRATTVTQNNFAVLGGGAGQARGPAFHDVDMSLFKEFPIRQVGRIEFRAEAFNVGNWAEYAAPSNLNILDPVHFGQITGVRNNNRILQLALKFYY